MTKHGSILRQSDAGWQIAAADKTAAWQTVHGAGKINPERLAGQAAEYVASQGLSPNVAVSIASTSVMAAKFETTKPAELRDRRLLGYKVEQLLPVAAEDFAADYLNEGNQVLGIVTSVGELLPIVKALEEQGLKVQSVSPAAISALQLLFEKSGTPSCDLLLWQDDDSLEFFDVGRRALDWQHLPAEATALTQQMGAKLLQKPGSVKVALVNVDSSLRNALGRFDQIEIQDVEAPPLSELARRSGSLALAGKSKPWVELRQGQLMAGDPHRAVRSDWRRCVWATAALLLATAFFFWMRARQYESEIDKTQSHQQSLFEQVFPNARVPNAVASRLKSEHRKLMGARGSDAAVEQPASALNVLHELVTGMPEDLRLQVQQIRIEDGKIDLDLNVRTVGSAGELASALENQGFSIEPPTTEQNDPKKVAVRINGKLDSERREDIP